MGRHADPWRWLAVGLAYYGAAWAGIRLSQIPETVSAVWPATGVAIAALILVGLRAWPAIFVAAALVEYPAFGASSLLVAAGNTLEAVLGAWILGRFGGVEAFSSARGVAGFLLALSVAPLPSTITGTAATFLQEGGTPLTAVAFTWYLGDLMGGLVVAPVILLSLTRSPIEERSATEWVAFLGTSAVLAFLAFYPWRPADLEAVRFGFVVLGPVAWAAARFGPKVTAWAAVGFGMAALGGLAAGTVRLFGPGNLVLLQMHALLALATVLGLFLAANVVERNGTIRALEKKSQELQDALEALERAQELKTRFLNKAAHEMRTPLTPVRMMSHVLLSDPSLSEKHLRAATVIERNSKRMERLIADLLEAANVERLQEGLEFAPVPSAGVLDKARRHIEAEAEARGVEVATSSDDSALQADATAVHRILANLLSNAVRHAPRGSQVLVSAARDGEMVRLAVDDAGPGVSAEDRSRLFEPFIEMSQVRGNEGAGLGLFVVRSLVDGHAGTVHVEDSPMGGARFVVRLPAA